MSDQATPEQRAAWLEEFGPYDKGDQGPMAGPGAQYGWVTVKAPNGKYWKVPPNSPEAKKYPRTGNTEEDRAHVGSEDEFMMNHKGWAPPVEGSLNDGKAAAPPVDPMDEKINEFYRRMMAPLDPNDPEVKAVTGNATAVANREAANRGIAGGMSVTGATEAALKAQGGMTQFRQGLAANALGMQSNRDLGLKNLEVQKYQLENQNELARYQSKQAQTQAIGGMVGGAAGFVVGGPGGAAIGSQLGAGAAGGMTQSYKPRPPPGYKNSGGTY